MLSCFDLPRRVNSAPCVFVRSTDRIRRVRRLVVQTCYSALAAAVPSGAAAPRRLLRRAPDHLLRPGAVGAACAMRSCAHLTLQGMSSAGLRLPSEVLRFIAEALWQDVRTGEREERDRIAEAAFIDLSCASRTLSEICSRLRWSSVRISSRRSMTTVKMLLWRPALRQLVQSLDVRIPLFVSRLRLPTYPPGDLDALVTLLGVVRVRKFTLRIGDDCDPLGEEATVVKALRDAERTFQRLAIAFSLVPRPELSVLSLKGDVWMSLVQDPGGPWNQLPGSMLGSVLTGSTHLGTLELDIVSLTGPDLGMDADVPMPTIEDITMFAVKLSDGVATAFGRCVGACPDVLLEAPMATRRLVLAAAHEEMCRAAPEFDRGFSWRFTATDAGEEEASPAERAAAERWVVEIGEAMPGLHAICDEESQVLVSAANSTELDNSCYASDLSPLVIAARLADQTYGRALKRIKLNCSQRCPELEAVCSPRGIRIEYYLCVSAIHVAPSDPSSGSEFWTLKPYFTFRP